MTIACGDPPRVIAWTLAAARAPAAIDRQPACSKPAARRCRCRSTGQTDARTDGRTPDRYMTAAHRILGGSGQQSMCSTRQLMLRRNEATQSARLGGRQTERERTETAQSNVVGRSKHQACNAQFSAPMTHTAGHAITTNKQQQQQQELTLCRPGTRVQATHRERQCAENYNK